MLVKSIRIDFQMRFCRHNFAKGNAGKIIKAGKKESLKVVTEAERDEMTAVTIALNPLVCGLETDKEKVEYLLEEYPELQSWL